MTKSAWYGVIASVGLLILYGMTMTLLGGLSAAIEQFTALWYLMLPLAVGFGIQVELYTRLRQAIQQRAQGVLTAGGTSASLGMLACCAHHAADMLPILGLSAAATLVGQYQKPILLVSLIINMIGIAIIWRHLRSVV